MRASNLSAGQFLVTDVQAETAFFGALPCRLLANIPGATAMKFGNTVEELAGSRWKDYAAESHWAVRSGGGLRTVYASFLTPGGHVHTSAVVPAPNGTPMQNPLSEAIQDQAIGNGIWSQDFKHGVDRWCAYDYNGGVNGGGNVFYPATHDKDGYIWTDASRWQIDTPENPHSVLALVMYPRWAHPGAPYIWVHGMSMRCQLRGKNLDLKGGQAFWWLVDDNGRYYQRAHPLTVVNDQWTANEVYHGSINDGWVQSWSSDGVPRHGPLMDQVMSFGFGFTGFPTGDMPTGRLELNKGFSIRA